MGEAERERLRRTVAKLSGPAAVISAVHGRIDPELLFDPAMRPDGEEKTRQLTFEDLLREEAGDGHDDHAGHLHAAYESVDFTSDVPLDPRRFIAFLDSRPEGLYRIKGFADFGAGDRDNKYALHAVGRFLRFVPQPWARGEQRLTQLVLIGAGIDAEAVGAGLTACRAEPTESREPGESPEPEQASADGLDTPDAERAMWGVLRYVQQEPEPEDVREEAAAEA